MTFTNVNFLVTLNYEITSLKKNTEVRLCLQWLSNFLSFDHKMIFLYDFFFSFIETLYLLLNSFCKVYLYIFSPMEAIPMKLYTIQFFTYFVLVSPELKRTVSLHEFLAKLEQGSVIMQTFCKECKYAT